jgi:uncharacterized protein (TIGR03435 family)
MTARVARFFIVTVASLAVAASAQTLMPGTNSPNAPNPIATPALNFDVVSIQPNKSSNGMMSVTFPSNGDSITITNLSLFQIITYAYNYHHNDLVFGMPDWTKSERYDITAKVAEQDVVAYQKLTDTERRLVFQKVLADRFKLQLHRELKVLPVYALVVAKTGLKMKPATPGDTYPNGIKAPNGTVFHGLMTIYDGRGQLKVQAGSTLGLALLLSNVGIGRQVVDKTGLTDPYDFTLQWTPDQAMYATGPGSQPESAPVADSNAPSIFTAVQEQLGLKLEPDKAPVECLVIDHIEMPSAN